ncbi:MULTISPECIES: hypothetical protein [unclassified Nocardioides]|uniref:hypothetical protein n=1 Tax=unclassified Nocardioides TaxID=2615069 RepID=UPI0006F1D158|nr:MULTISPECIES: hypothetical protein [unclassified Nocardioides]KRA32456.1 hypothetical protein ASD81_12890 [Nocardioides sp. Root614]KRA89109.1 hypothetical protein ASD84_13155 [Nocardioides sp. Root682]
MSHRDIERVLAGELSYDTLADPEQAVVRTAWDGRIDAARKALDLEAEFKAAGETWSESDAGGSVVTRAAESDR